MLLSEVIEMYKMTEEEKILYDIANNIMNSNYSFDIKKYRKIDWILLLKKAMEHKVVPHVFKKVKSYLSQKEKTIYHIYIAKHKAYIDNVIKQTAKVTKEFDRKSFNYVIIKGFVLSQILYDDYYLRQFSDVDVLIHEDNIINACYTMEDLGYVDLLIESLQKTIESPDFNKSFHYLSEHEKKFVKEANILVEIKKSVYGYKAKTASGGINNRYVLDIGSKSFFSLKPSNLFIFMIKNMFVNFFGEWGIKSDYIIRDLIDFYSFLIKYKAIFTNEYLKKLFASDCYGHLYMVMNVIKDFFSYDSLQLIPLPLLELETKIDLEIEIDKHYYVEWESDFFRRLYNKKERIDEYNWFMYNRAVYINPTESLITNDLNKYPYDYKKGIIELNYSFWINLPILNLVSAPMLFNADYDKENLFVSFKIYKAYPNMWFEITLLKSVVKKGEPFEYKISFEFVNKEIKEVVMEIDDIKTFNSIINDFNILTIKIPKKTNIKFVKDNRNDFFMYFVIKFLNRRDKFSHSIGGWGNYHRLLKISYYL